MKKTFRKLAAAVLTGVLALSLAAAAVIQKNRNLPVKVNMPI